jgi:uncharacterized membrane protein YfcA
MAFSIYLPIAGVAANVLLLSGAGAAVGFLAGMFGVGGGFLLTPLLIFLGIPPEVAIATGANQATATAVAGAVAHFRRGNIDLRMGGILVAAGLVGVVLGIGFVNALRRLGQFEVVLLLSYVVLLGTVGTLMLVESLNALRRATTVSPVGRRAYHHTWVHGLPLRVRFPHSRLYISVLPPAVIGLFTGFLTAVMGVGGGFVLVPAMVYLLNMRTAVAVGTSLFQIVFVSAFTTVLQAISVHSVDIVLGFVLIVSGVVGTQIGARAGATLKGEQLRALLALLVLAVSLRVAVDLVTRPDELYAISSIQRGP